MRCITLAVATLSIGVLWGCDAEPVPDAGLDGGGCGSCEGVTPSCDGQTSVSCELDTDGCAVTVRTDCALAGGSCGSGVCDLSCADVPAFNRCATDGERSCLGDTLEVCAANADGCLVRTSTDCAASPGGVCDDSASAMCVLPADPCLTIPSTERCDTLGTSCDSDTLVTCAPNAFGCLVETRADCASRASGTCVGSPSPAACVFEGDPCADVTLCSSVGVACDGPERVSCAADAFGCRVETRVDCTSEAFGFCDEDRSSCSTAALDPCMGLTECSPDGVRCDSGERVACAPNAFGCSVESRTDCSAGGDTCGERDGRFVCDDVCSFRAVCPAATYCDGDERVTCAADADGCVVESGRASCDPDQGCATDTCVDLCAPAVVIDCSEGTIGADTDGGPSVLSDYSACTGGTYATPEATYIFRNAADVVVDLVATRGSGTADWDLFVLDGGDATQCTAATCLGMGTETTGVDSLSFVAEADHPYFVVWDSNATGGETSSYTLSVSCTALVCGDSAIVGPEECDDGNTADGDGCSSACELEPLHTCTSAEPTVCTPTCGNGTLEATGEVCDDGNTTDGDGCSSACSVESLYSCTVADPSVCTATCGNGALDHADERCDDSNTADDDGCDALCQVERLYVCEGEPSTCTVACGNGLLDGADEQCDDDNPLPGDGCDERCRFEPGYYCDREPSFCGFTVCGDGFVDVGESCDDGGAVSGDGCSASCALELPAAGATLALSGSIDDTDRLFVRPWESCELSGGSGYYHDGYIVENTTGSPQTLHLYASWTPGQDGFLMVYRYPLNTEAPEHNCVAGDDDGPLGTGDSELSGVRIAPTERLVVVATSYETFDPIGAYNLEVTVE